uniref:Protein-associating with the carboxyl-terminal domain of ezrin isoform X2 n=1 Tax=Geotrypetes seraphini TaxID=260995 RepID=A0A6P8SEB2_GEOSA|nr:protein-associating with the carboxyl-terminal domain of ezrin isoform X2 [Geotrypetes seraphini]
MGSENSALRSSVLQEPPCPLASGLSLYRAVLTDGRPASVFVYSPEKKETVSKAAQYLKTLRHPCLLRFLSCVVEADGIHLVTERVQPLETAMENLFSEEICAGIYDILQALVFLHDRGNSAHNNIRLSSVFVSEDGHWKLGGMEMVCKLTETPPQSAEFGILPEAYGHARDAFDFGKLVESLLLYMNDQDLVSSFQDTVCSSLLNSDPLRRPPLHNLLSHEFFRFLLDRVSCLSEELIAFRLAPLLLNQLVFAEPAAVKSFLPHLLRPKHDSQRSQTECLLSPALFQTYVIPIILKLFKVHEEHVRMVLLSHIDAYADLFSQEELKAVILPQVLLGLRDTSDPLVAVTLHSLAVLVSFLGPEVVVGGERTKIFKSTTPGFTKTADTTPEDSPVHIVNNLKPVMTQAVKNNLSNLLPKGTLSGKMFFNGEETLKKCLEETEALGSLQTGQNVVQTFLNLSKSEITSSERDSCTLLNSFENTAEEWPDWSESEEVGVSGQDVISGTPARNNAGDQAEPRTCLKAYHTSSNNIKGLESLAATFQPGMKCSPPKASPAACSNNSWKQPVIEEEKNSDLRTQMSSEKELGLGEEFTIQVRKKLQDPELDWFADMIPIIKPSSTLQILPKQRTELVDVVPNQEEKRNMEALSFSSRFAAEITEVEAGGWSGDDDLNWEEDENNW